MKPRERMSWGPPPHYAVNENGSSGDEIDAETLQICNEKQQVRYNLKHEYTKFKREIKNFN